MVSVHDHRPNHPPSIYTLPRALLKAHLCTFTARLVRRSPEFGLDLTRGKPRKRDLKLKLYLRWYGILRTLNIYAISYGHASSLTSTMAPCLPFSCCSCLPFSRLPFSCCSCPPFSCCVNKKELKFGQMPVNTLAKGTFRCTSRFETPPLVMLEVSGGGRLRSEVGDLRLATARRGGMRSGQGGKGG